MINFGIDLGFGFTKDSYYDDGKIVCDKFISAVAWDVRKRDGMYDYDRRYWKVGEGALSSKNIIELTNYALLEEFAPLLLLEAINRAGLKAENIGTVVCGLSLAHAREADSFVKKLSSFVVDGKKYEFEISLVPQAEGAMHTIKKTYNDSTGNFMVIDIGSNTIDALVCEDGSMQENTLDGYENRGVRRVAQLLQQHLVKNDIGELTIPQSLKVLEDRKVKLYGVETDLDVVIKQISRDFTKETLQFIRNKYDHELKVLDRIFFVGGGAHYIGGTEDIGLPHAVIPEDPEYFNAVGNLLSAKEQIT
ncbi:MAG: ParM/StbA family protein [Campylobacterota bacterium]|nr:ParM/StbA family protein [Campylobacterota bacterium]